MSFVIQQPQEPLLWPSMSVAKFVTVLQRLLKINPETSRHRRKMTLLDQMKYQMAKQGFSLVFDN
jgi:hypothetical protein